MTNAQIIATEKLLNGVTEDVHTYQVWKRLGFQVQRGEHALFSTKIWKRTTKKMKDGEEYDSLIMVNAAFFGESQVASISEGAA